MNKNINLLRLACLIQDRDNQDFKRVVLSLIFEIIFENNNIDLKANELFITTIEKCSEPIERDFFDGILTNSDSFVLTNTEDEPLVRLTPNKFSEVEKSIEEFSIETPIVDFLNIKSYDIDYKDVIIKILYESIYENIYAFNPKKIKTLVPNIVKENFEQQELNIFNEFLEYEDPKKNRILYNQFVKAIEFAILTSGKGVKKFTDKLYTDKAYLLDTNVVFRMLGVGGLERKETILKLIESCIKQGVTFEYTLRTQVELNHTLDASINKIGKAEQSKKISIIQGLVEENPHFFNDDFITQYSRLKNERIVNSPEQYGIEMKTRFKKLCSDYNISIANHGIKLENYEVGLYSKKLISKRKELNYNFRYSSKQATVDAYNVLYVNKRRGNNNYNYSEVKSFYLTTDRSLNKILSDDDSIIIPATILPSQLFVIHNPLNSTGETVDFDNFFSFIKRRTSEFKHRGRDVFSFINQAQVFTSDEEEIKNMIVTFTDERYNHSKKTSVDENVIIKFKDFSKTYFDKRLNDVEKLESRDKNIQKNGNSEFNKCLKSSKNKAKYIDLIITVILIPFISLLAGLITNEFKYSLIILFILELIKFGLSKKANYNKQLWEYFFNKKIEKTSYYILTKDDKYVHEGLKHIEDNKGDVWK